MQPIAIKIHINEHVLNGCILDSEIKCLIYKSFYIYLFYIPYKNI